MARRKTTSPKRPIKSDEHKDEQRVNNPPVGLVTPETDPDAGQKRTYAYDPHLEPQLQWAGKAEHTPFAATRRQGEAISDEADPTDAAALSYDGGLT